MNKNELHYYAVIPSKILIDKNITPNAKLLYGIISSLTNIGGRCFASDNYFAEIFDVSKVSIQNWLRELENAGHISRKIFYKGDSKEIDHRDIILNGLTNDVDTTLRTSSVKSKELDLEKLQTNNNKDNNNKDKGIHEIKTTGIQENLTTGIQENLVDNIIKENNKDRLAKANASSQVSSNIDIDIDNKDNNNNTLDIENNLNSRNLKAVLIPYIEESFSNDEVKSALREWVIDVFANGKTLTLKQLINQCDLLTSNCETKEELISLVNKTLESKWATFRYVIEAKNKSSKNNQQSKTIRVTEQKRTVKLGTECF